MEELIKKIKQKKELSDLPDELVKEELASYFQKHGIRLSGLSKRELSVIVKDVRDTLRKYTGRFKASDKKRSELLKQDKIPELLKTHTSTKERLQDYPKLKALIRKVNPESILDIGCGLNPIKISGYFPDAHYHALDIREKELKLVETFFAKHNIDGDIHLIDIRKMKKLPEVDLTLVMKTLDIIETKGHKHATEIMKKLKQSSKNIIVSFSTRTLSGKPMAHVKRLWFERLCESQKIPYKVKTTKNEIFYILSEKNLSTSTD